MLRFILARNIASTYRGTFDTASSVCRGRISPVCGGVLLGLTAVPAFAASVSQAAEPPAQPRLRLATILESLRQERQPAPDAPPATAGTAEMASPATEPAPLALEWTYQLPEGPAAQPAAQTVVPPSSGGPPEGTRPPQQPKPGDKPSRGDAAPIPARRSTSVKSDAQDPADDKSGKTKRDTETSRTPAAPVLAAAETAESAAPRGSDAKVVGDGDFRPADELDAEPAVADLPVPSRNKGSAAADQATTPRKRWGMAPVRWGGTLSAGLRRSTSENSTSTTSEIYEARLRANSYIWKPYIALVSGDFALTAIRSQDSGDAASSNLAGTSVTGSGTLNLFPQSRFPFTASLALSDSRSNGSFSTSNIEQRRLSLRQDYRPQIGQWTAAAGYDRSELTGTFGSDTVDRVFGNYSNVLGKHSVNLSGDFTRSRADGQSSRSYYLGGGHGFSFSDELSLNTNASITGQQFGIGSEDSTTAKTQSTQVFSYANWTPMDSKWRGSANLRYFETNNTIAGTTFESRTLGGAANLTYQASRNLSFFGTAGINVDSDRRVNSNQALGVSYSGDPRHLGGYDYTWFTSASATNSTAAKGITSRSINGSLGHSLVRSWQISDQSLLSGSVTQSVTNSRTTGLGSASTTTLNHGASLSMQANAGDRLTGYLSTSFSDSRTRGDATSSFQLFNVQLTGNWRVDANSELDSNLTWQWSRQQSDRINQPVVLIDQFGRPVFRDDTSRTGNTSLSGGVGYSHRRFAGIRGLRYRLDFRANTNRDDSRRFGNPDALREQDRATLDLDQRLLYRIGRLDTELQYRIAEIRGERNQLLFFRVIREFGSF